MVLATVHSKERQESTWWRDLHREVTLKCQSFIDPKRSFREEKVFLTCSCSLKGLAIGQSVCQDFLVREFEDAAGRNTPG